jgi:hypothetical protein
MDPRADWRIDEDFRKGAVEDVEERGDPREDALKWQSGAVAITEDVMSADTADIKHAEEELGADDDGTPG